MKNPNKVESLIKNTLSMAARLLERNWLVNLGIDVNEFEEDISGREAAKIVVQRLEAKRNEVAAKIGEEAAMEYDGIVDAFKDEAADPQSTTGSFDSAMQELYDFADARSIWVG